MKRPAYALIAALALFQTAAHAVTVTGTIKTVDPAGMKLGIVRNDDRQELPKELELVVQTDAKLTNIISLQDLQEGNQVKADVKENKDARIWEAKSVELVSSEETTAA